MSYPLRQADGWTLNMTEAMSNFCLYVFVRMKSWSGFVILHSFLTCLGPYADHHTVWTFNGRLD